MYTAFDNQLKPFALNPSYLPDTVIEKEHTFQ